MHTQTHLNGYCVSTVHLPVMHLGGQYESMIFKSDGEEVTDYLDLYCDRYETEELAREGHDNLVERIRGGWGPNDES